MHDELCATHVGESIHRAIPWFLMACYAYEVRDSPIISDACFDKLGEDIRTRWGEINHPHKHLILNMSDIWKPSTINVDMAHLPLITKDAAEHLIQKPGTLGTR